MARFFTFHWQNRFWRSDINKEYERTAGSGGSIFRKRGVAIGDVIYVVSLAGGQLYLGRRMKVEQIVSRAEAVRIFDSEDLWDADEWVIDTQGTPLNLHRRLAPQFARQLRFLTTRGEVRGLCFVSETHLDNQATRGLHELTRESAALLDRVIEITDRLPQGDEVIEVTEEMLSRADEPVLREPAAFPDEIPHDVAYREGASVQVQVNRYERDAAARAQCIAHYGTTCSVCAFDFVTKYGPMMAGFVHVHHVRSLSSLGADYNVDPVRDLRPVCPNCHAVLHRREPPYSVDEVRKIIERRRGSRVSENGPRCQGAVERVDQGHGG